MLEYIRSSDLDNLICPQKFDYSVQQKLDDPRGNRIFAFGHGWHKFHELFRQEYMIAQDDLYAREYALAGASSLVPIIEGEEVRTRDKLAKGVMHYFAQYPVSRYKPFMLNGKPMTEVLFLHKFKGIRIPVRGTIDLVTYCDVNEGTGEELWLVDYKHTSRIETAWVDQYSVSNQFKCYYSKGLDLWNQGILPVKPAGVLVDLFHVTKGAVKTGKTQAHRDGCAFYTLPIRYNEFILEEWERTVDVSLGAVEYYKSRGHYPLNAPLACRAFGSPCPFLDICGTQNPDTRAILLENWPRKADEEEHLFE